MREANLRAGLEADMQKIKLLKQHMGIDPNLDPAMYFKEFDIPAMEFEDIPIVEWEQIKWLN